MTEASTDPVTLMRALYEAFGQGDIPTVLASMDDSIEWSEAEGNPWSPGHPFVGPQQVVEEVFQCVGAEFDGFEIHPTRFLGAGDTVVMEGRYRSTELGPAARPAHPGVRSTELQVDDVVRVRAAALALRGVWAINHKPRSGPVKRDSSAAVAAKPARG